MEYVEFACFLGESEAIGMVRMQYVQAKPARLVVTPVNSPAGSDRINGSIALQDIHVSLGGGRFYAAKGARDTSLCVFIRSVARGTWTMLVPRRWLQQERSSPKKARPGISYICLIRSVHAIR